MSIETLIARAAAGETLPSELALDREQVRRHGLGPLAHALGAIGFDRDSIASSLICQRQEADAAEAIAAITAIGVPVLLIKGIASARRHYPAPEQRPMTDIDLLVPTDALDDAARALARRGFWPAGEARERGRFHHALTLKRPGAAIDLHRSIVQPLRRGATITGLWQRAVSAPADLGGLYPDLVDEALITLAHLARHELAVRALSYVDAARMLGKLDRGELEERARRAGLWRGVEQAVAMTDSLVGGVCPPSLRDLRADVLAHRQPSRRRQLFIKLALLESPMDLARLALGAALETLA